MRLLNLPSSTPAILLLVLAAVFALGNLWYSAARSTIPTPLSGQVTKKIRLAEKHPGVDDVYLLVLDDRQRVQVDRPIFAATSVNSRLTKTAWSRTLQVDQQELRLSFSPDVFGMLIVMPALWLLCVFLAASPQRYLGLPPRSGASSR